MKRNRLSTHSHGLAPTRARSISRRVDHATNRSGAPARHLRKRRADFEPWSHVRHTVHDTHTCQLQVEEMRLVTMSTPRRMGRCKPLAQPFGG